MRFFNFTQTVTALFTHEYTSLATDKLDKEKRHFLKMKSMLHLIKAKSSFENIRTVIIIPHCLA